MPRISEAAAKLAWTKLAALKEDLIIRGKGGSGRKARSHLWDTSHRAGVPAQCVKVLGRFLAPGVHHLFLPVDSSVHVGDATRRVHLDFSKKSESVSGMFSIDRKIRTGEL